MPDKENKSHNTRPLSNYINFSNLLVISFAFRV